MAANHDQLMLEKCLRIIRREKFDDSRLEKIMDTALSLKSKKQCDLLNSAMREYIERKSDISTHDYDAGQVLKTFHDIFSWDLPKDLGLRNLGLLDDQEILQKYLPLFNAGNIRPSKAAKIRQAVIMMEDPQSKQQLQDAIRCFIIKQACEIQQVQDPDQQRQDQDQQKEEVAQIFTDRELLSPTLLRGVQLVELGQSTLWLPNEVFGHLFDYLAPKDLYKTAQVCKDWHAHSKKKIDTTAFKKLLVEKDEESAKGLLKRKVLSPEELDKIWDTFIAPTICESQDPWNGAYPHKKPREFTYLFADQLLKLIQNKEALNTHFEWILFSIKDIENVQIKRLLLTQVCARYQGGKDERVDLIFKIIEESLSKSPMARNSVIMAIAQNTELMERHLERIFECSHMYMSVEPKGSIERFKTIARYYTGDPQILFDYAEKQWNTLRHRTQVETYAIYKGLLMNKELSSQCYPTLVKQIMKIDSAEEYIYLLDYINRLIRHYVAGYSDKLLRNILTTGELLKSDAKELTLMVDVYETLDTWVQYHTQKGDKKIEDELRDVSSKLVSKHPGVLVQREALGVLRKKSLSFSELENTCNNLTQARLPLLRGSDVHTAFLKHLKDFIADPKALDANYEKIVQIITSQRGVPAVWDGLMKDLVQRYQGNNIDPILEALRAVSDSRSVSDIVTLLAKQGRLTLDNVEKLIAAPECFPAKFYPDLAQFYTGPAQDILDVAKKNLDASIGGDLLLGLLKNQSLSLEDYETIIKLLTNPPLRGQYYSKLTELFAQVRPELRMNFVLDLIKYYSAGESDKLTRCILAFVMVIADPQEKVLTLTNILEALGKKAKYRLIKRSKVERCELKGVAQVLRDLYFFELPSNEKPKKRSNNSRRKPSN